MRREVNPEAGIAPAPPTTQHQPGGRHIIAGGVSHRANEIGSESPEGDTNYIETLTDHEFEAAR